MQDIFVTFTENLIAEIIVFLVLFGLIAYLLARDKFVSLLYGFFRVIISFFYSPFIYMKKAVLSLAEYGTKGEGEFIKTKQYLLNKLMLSLQAVLVVLSIALLASSLVSGWNQMLPPKDLRVAISNLEEELGKEETELQQIEPNVKQMDAAWSNQRDSLIGAYNLEHARKNQAALAENADLADHISRLGAAVEQSFLQVRNYYSQNESFDRAFQFERVKTDVKDFIDRLGAPQEAKELMLKYNDNWYALMLSKLETSNFSEAQLRSVVQSTYSNLKDRMDYINRATPYQQQELTRLQAQVKYDIKALFFQFLYGVFQFILLVWAVGLTIEALWIAIHVAANVQMIQDNLASK